LTNIEFENKYNKMWFLKYIKNMIFKIYQKYDF